MLALPFGVAFVGTAASVGCTGEDRRWKVLASGIVAASLAVRLASSREPRVLVFPDSRRDRGDRNGCLCAGESVTGNVRKGQSGGNSRNRRLYLRVERASSLR